MSRFNLNNITLSSKADITKIMENFNKIETDARTANEISTMISNYAAPKSHNIADNTYGLGTTGLYGHCKVINNLTRSAFANGEALAAYQGKLLSDSITSLNNSLGGMAKRTYSYGTANPSGGSNGDVYDQYF